MGMLSRRRVRLGLANRLKQDRRKNRTHKLRLYLRNCILYSIIVLTIMFYNVCVRVVKVIICKARYDIEEREGY
jgi:hypothetical protein